ncbi:MAG: C69 family dipeptidase [Brevefilum sp.]|nr:C69 family dipeptidase [Brevefilum sp.]
MCDSFVALSNATKDGSVIFGKNSDRHPNEGHALRLIPRASHPKGAQVDCTYIRIPQVRETNAVLLSKPFWIWGAEMGANEHGVVIGNEAVFTKVPYDKEPGLIGMDFIRLALERAATADEALDVMIELLATYGQGGNAMFSHKMFYHNGFLIADPHSAWIFETAGSHWAAEKVRDVRTISNLISIGATWDRASSGLVSHAVNKGWCKNAESFNFSECYSDLVYTNFAAGKHRSCRIGELLSAHVGEIDIPFAMQVLRDHGPEANEKWQPGNGIVGAEVCMHASFGPVRGSQTTGSMISHLAADGHTHWLTGTSAPCTSVFKPVWFDSGLPEFGAAPTGEYDHASLWWRHENLHRELLRDYATRIKVIEGERDKLEENFIAQVQNWPTQPIEARAGLTRDCFYEVEHVEAKWLEMIVEKPVVNRRSILDQIAWRNFDRQAQRPRSSRAQIAAYPHK